MNLCKAKFIKPYGGFGHWLHPYVFKVGDEVLLKTKLPNEVWEVLHLNGERCGYKIPDEVLDY